MVERESEPEDDGLWNSPVGNTVGSFDANGVFRISGGEGEELQPLAELEESPAVPPNDEATDTSPAEEDDNLIGVKTSGLSLQPQEPTYSGHGSEKPDVVSPILSQHAVGSIAPVDNNRISVTMLTGKPIEAFAARDSDEFTPFGGKSPLSTSHPPGLVPEPGFKSLPVEMSKWLYRDPSGSIQGPFLSGEMHEWYKGGFFTPDLLVKREQDSTFEPLGSLIRRVGSDDQPFLTAGVIRPEPPQPPVHPNRPSIPSLAQNRQPVPQLPQSPGWMGMSAPSTPNTANFGADRLMLQQQQVQQQHSSGDLFSSTNELGQQRSGFGGAQEPVALSGVESRWSSAQFSRPQIAESNAGWGGDSFSRSPVASMAAAHTPLGSAHYMEQQQRLHNQELERQQYMQLLQRQAQMQFMHQQQFMAARQQFGTDPQALAALLAQQQAQQRQLQMRYQQLQFTGFHAQGPSTPGGTAVPWGGMGQPSSPWTTSIIPSNSDNYFDYNKGEGSQAPYSMRQQPTPMQPLQPHQQQHQPFQPFQQEHTQFHPGRPGEPVMQVGQAPQPSAQEPQEPQLQQQQQQQQRQQQELYQHQSRTAHEQPIDVVADKMADLQVQEEVDQEAAKDDFEPSEQTLPVVEEVTRAEDVKVSLEQVEAAIQEKVYDEEKLEDWEEIEDPVNELTAQHERNQQDIKEDSVQDDDSVDESLVHEEHEVEEEQEVAEATKDTASETASTTAAAELPASSSIKASPAPWAKPTNVDDEVVEKKGLTLREIQELEAKKSEVTKAERQAQLATSAALTGGNGAFDFTKGMSGAPAWSSSAPTAPKKKTLKEIQEEEEATIKKNRVAAKQAQTAGLAAIVTSNTGSVGKRYADTIGPKVILVASIDKA